MGIGGLKFWPNDKTGVKCLKQLHKERERERERERLLSRINGKSYTGPNVLLDLTLSDIEMKIRGHLDLTPCMW